MPYDCFGRKIHLQRSETCGALIKYGRPCAGGNGGNRNQEVLTKNAIWHLPSFNSSRLLLGIIIVRSLFFVTSLEAEVAFWMTISSNLCVPGLSNCGCNNPLEWCVYRFLGCCCFLRGALQLQRWLTHNLCIFVLLFVNALSYLYWNPLNPEDFKENCKYPLQLKAQSKLIRMY